MIINAAVEKPEDFKNITLKITPQGASHWGMWPKFLYLKTHFLKIREDGQEMVGLGIIAKPQANPLEVASRLHAIVKDLSKTMPPSMTAIVSLMRHDPFGFVY